MELYLIAGVAVILFLILIGNIKIVPQSRAYVIERLGTYYKTWETGPHFKIPFMEKIAKQISLKEQVVDFPPQPVITKDNVTMQIDTVIFYQITDPKLYTYGVEHPLAAIENLSATTLRNIIGEMDLDSTLTSRDIINSKIRIIVDEVTDAWGIKVNRVELKNILPPREIQTAMEKEMKAERERRQVVIEAEASKRSQELVAEGKKLSVILNAEAENQSTILKAEAEKRAAILKAEASKEAKVREAEGEAVAIQKVQEAVAAGIKMINEAAPSDAVLAIKSLEAFEKAADGKATKIIIPSNIQSLAGLASSIKEVVND